MKDIPCECFTLANVELVIAMHAFAGLIVADAGAAVAVAAERWRSPRQCSTTNDDTVAPLLHPMWCPLPLVLPLWLQLLPAEEFEEQPDEDDECD